MFLRKLLRQLSSPQSQAITQPVPCPLPLHCLSFFWPSHYHLKAALRSQPSLDWTEHLGLVLLGIRTALKSDIHGSTAELVFGTSLRLPGMVSSFSLLKLIPCPIQPVFSIAFDHFAVPSQLLLPEHQQLVPSTYQHSSLIAAMSTCDTTAFVPHSHLPTTVLFPLSNALLSISNSP